MIVFKTMSQATNYLKRHKGYFEDHGCGCCYVHEFYKISGNRVLRYLNQEQAGNSGNSTITIIGKIKGVRSN
jgi:hypothetical protein